MLKINLKFIYFVNKYKKKYSYNYFPEKYTWKGLDFLGLI